MASTKAVSLDSIDGVNLYINLNLYADTQSGKSFIVSYECKDCNGHSI